MSRYVDEIRANEAIRPSYADPSLAAAASDRTFSYVGRNSQGALYYKVTSPDVGDTSEIVRVQLPTHPQAGVAHNFLYVLPVEPGLKKTYGDGMATMESLDAEDKYDLTIIEPSFASDPWYADNPDDSRVKYETFMDTQLLPWVKANFAVSGTEQNWLLGFSKSGVGGEDLILRHPDLFSLVASWDFPADISRFNQFGLSSANSYGTEANFEANYQLTRAFVDAHKAPFLTKNRIWIGGADTFRTDLADYSSLLTSERIPHTVDPARRLAHRWDSGWVSSALGALYQDSLKLPSAS
jgi:S-formylglutathione hydrolase FrmB